MFRPRERASKQFKCPRPQCVNDIETEIKRKIAVRNKCYYALGPILKRRAISQSVKFRLYKIIIRPAVTYRAQTWTMTKKIEIMLMTWERKILRKIYGPTKEKGQWKIKTIAELITKYKSQDVLAVIKIRILEWLGHVIRMNETRGVKRIFEGKLEGRRGR